MFILHEVVFGEKNEEDASSHRNVSFTYSGGDVKLIYNRNNLHIKQLDAFCRFLIFLFLVEEVRPMHLLSNPGKRMSQKIRTVI